MNKIFSREWTPLKLVTVTTSKAYEHVGKRNGLTIVG